MLLLIKLRKTVKSNYLLLLSFILISLLCFSLLIHTHYFIGFLDSPFHLGRILELREDLKHGNLMPTIAINQFHGSKIMSIYPYINLYPIAIISLFISSKIYILNTWFILNLFFALIFSFYGCYLYTKSKLLSYIFSIIYTTPLYFLCMGNGFNDFGVTTSRAVLPLILFGCLALIKSHKYVELSLGMTLLIYSHILDSLIGVAFIASFLLLNLFKLNKLIFAALIKAISLTILLTSIVWLPLIYSLTNINSISLPAYAHEILGTASLTSDFSINYLNANISIFAVLGIILSIIFYIHLSNQVKKLFFISIFFLIICNTYFPWELMPHFITNPLFHLQYISRLFIIPQIILSYVFTVILYKYILLRIKHINFNAYKLSIFSIILLIMSFQIYNQRLLITKWSNGPYITKSYYLHNNNNGTLGPLEPYKIKNQKDFKYLFYDYEFTNYFPNKSYTQDNNILHYDGLTNTNSIIHLQKNGYNTFKFSNSTDLHNLQLPFVIYKGTNLSIILNHHLIRHITHKNGQIIINNIPQGNNIIKIQNHPNILLICIRALLFASGLLWLLFKYKKQK